MKFLDMTFGAPAANIACDEALLEALDEDPNQEECLRIWESADYFVVLGHANRMADHVNIAACREGRIPIMRRISGGGTVVQGPGCLNYALTIRHAGRLGIAALYRSILERHGQVLSTLCGRPALFQGISDLTIDGMKFSGNAQYRKARAALVHGTFLLDFDLSVIERLLPLPPDQPAYRANRPHEQFVANLDLSRAAVVDALRRAWHARDPCEWLPTARIEQLIRVRYGTTEWSEKF